METRTPFSLLRRYLVFLPVLLIATYFVLHAQTKPIGDFGNYYYASLFFKEGKDLDRIYEPYRFNLDIYETGQKDFYLNYAPVPPLTLLVYVPFTFTGPVTAKLLWNIFNLLLFFITLYRLREYFKPAAVYMILFPAIFLYPVMNTVYFGQSYFLLLFLLSEGLLAYLQGKKMLAAVCWAICIHLKIFPGILLLFLLFEKDFRTLFYCLAACLLLLLLSLPLLGWNVWHMYLFDFLPRLSEGEINNLFSTGYQSTQVLLRNLFSVDLMHNPDPAYNNHSLYHIIYIFFRCLMLLCMLAVSFSKNIQTPVKFGLYMLFSILVSGYGTTYSLIVLIFVYLWMAGEKRNPVLLFTMVVLFLICNIPVNKLSSLPLLLQFPRLYLLLALLIICLLYLRPRLYKSYILAVSMAFLALILLPSSKTVNTGNYWLKKEEALLIYDFEIKNDSLVLTFFDINGPQKKTIGTGEKIHSVKEAAVQQVRTAARERVLKAVLVNDDHYVYLSDKERGIGFYTLRYQPLEQKTD